MYSAIVFYILVLKHLSVTQPERQPVHGHFSLWFRSSARKHFPDPVNDNSFLVCITKPLNARSLTGDCSIFVKGIPDCRFAVVLESPEQAIGIQHEGDHGKNRAAECWH